MLMVAHGVSGGDATTSIVIAGHHLQPIIILIDKYPSTWATHRRKLV